MKNNLEKFKQRLEKFEEQKRIKILHRGISKKDVFDRFNLDTKYNTIKQFKERLYFYGEKSKYFWKQRIKSDFGINDIDEKVFRYIFGKFTEIYDSRESLKKQKKNYVDKNRKKFEFFSKGDNLDVFLNAISDLSDNDKTLLRNYYFRIIHQLGETDYINQSLLVSSSQIEDVAKKFSKGDIIIYFWDFDFNNLPNLSGDGIVFFNGKPYENQVEISVFGAIFPHYIYAFKYEEKYYLNPALEKLEDEEAMDMAIVFGFNINQDGFQERAKTEIIGNTVEWDNGEFKEHKIYR
ncbi:hypothetical protein CAPN008_16110 [Capnocytophaga canis]|uniref:hypothetical protein n=1 Tax=Capnocytophaga canis TaxID=1848903 RepID=UPI001AD1787B|nr:hypothetical protein [Capnocytophaga canis]GIM61561.1 hypothetical protein CAPN008_16110 [Capnocytophaga canis]